jgi:hypothetical protein
VLVRDRESMAVDHRRPNFTIEWIAGSIGALAAAIGLLIFHGPADGVLRVFGWEWRFGDLAEGWPLSTVIVGALLLAAVTARVSQRMALRGSPTAADVASGASLLSMLLALVYAIVWIF